VITAPLSTEALKSYLGHRDLTEDLILSKELSFHWANWDQTCLYQRKHFKNFHQNEKLRELNEELLKLRSSPIWLCNKIKVVKSDKFSLYESYLDSRLRLTWFERKDEILFSDTGEQGPYYTLTSMKWMDQKIYTQFVMRKILLEHYTLRSFRLNSKIPVSFKLDNDFNIYEDKVAIHQISEMGFILKIADKKFINKISSAKELEIKIPLEAYLQVKNLSSIETFNALAAGSIGKNERVSFKINAKILNFYGNSQNAKRSSGEDFYIFAKYDDFAPVGNQIELKKIFKPIVEKAKIIISKGLEEMQNEKNKKMRMAA
jgi:hypothetical protein